MQRKREMWLVALVGFLSCNWLHAFLSSGKGRSLTRVIMKRRSPTIAVNSAASFDPDEFAGWCRSAAVQKQVHPIKDLELLMQERNATGLTTIRLISSEEMNGETTELDVCLLPAHKMFPSMLDTDKQCNAIAKSVAVRRVKTVDDLRFIETVDDLKGGFSVAWIGHTGVGKSSEANFVLMLFLTHLGEQGWPKQLAHRIDCLMYEYTYSADTNEVKCNITPAVNLASVREYCAKKRTLPDADLPVLFLELEEHEMDPRVQGLPTFVAVSSSNIYNTLKTLKKSTNLVTYVVRPHTPAEMHMIGQLYYHDDKAYLLSNLALDSTSSAEQASAVIDHRVATVGPLVRNVFQMKAVYNFYVDRVEFSAENTRLSSMSLKDLSIDYSPSVFTELVAPHPILNSDDSLCGAAEFKFLSAHIAALVMNKARTREQY